MTPPNSRGSSDADSLATAVCLALGVRDRPDAVRDWHGVFQAAVRERCAPLAWLRCGAEIAASTPGPITAAFRSYFATNAARAKLVMAAAHASTSALHSAGVSPIVLKGPPLAARLYGDSAARVCSDLDWFVPASRLTVVHDVMLTAGWKCIEGDLGGEVCYGRESGRGSNLYRGAFCSAGFLATHTFRSLLLRRAQWSSRVSLFWRMMIDSWRATSRHISCLRIGCSARVAR